MVEASQRSVALEKIRQKENGVTCAVLLLTVAQSILAFGNTEVPGDLERAIQTEHHRRKSGWRGSKRRQQRAPTEVGDR